MAAESDAERTGDVPVVDVDDAVHAEDPTDDYRLTGPGMSFADELLGDHEVLTRPRPPASKARRRTGQVMLGVGGLLIVLLAIYAADVLRNLGDVPRGVVVLGVEVGGMPQEEAEAKLRRELTPRLTEPIPIHAGDVHAKLDPTAAGLNLNWAATLEQAGRQPVNPIARAMSFFSTREVDVVSSVNPDALHKAVTELAQEELNHPPTEGGIGFEPVLGNDGAVHAFAIEPRQGQELADLDPAVRLIKENWLRPDPIVLPVDVTPVQATSKGVHTTLRKVVNPMISAPVRVHGKDVEAVLEPDEIAPSLRFSVKDSGALRVNVDRGVLKEEVLPQLQGTEQRATDATMVFSDSRPSVRPGKKGRQIDWAATFGSFAEVAKRDDDRVLPVDYTVTTPEVSTAELEGLGIDEVIGKFSTDGLSGPAAHNVSTIARKVNGAIVWPGETFRLNEYTGPHTGAAGYLPAPLHEDGSGEEVMAGGISQFTSTLFNAAYLAGLRDAEHTPHSYYFARYPVARDAVSLSEDGEPVPMAFTNDSETGVVIQASVSGDTVTVKLWGTKHHRVETSSGERQDVVPPPVEHEVGEDCEPRDGAAGFTVSSTRTIYDAETGDEIRKNTTTVTYAPRPKIVCHSA